VDVTGGQGWALLGLVGVLMSVIGGLVLNQLHLLRAYLDARFDTVDVRFASVERRLDYLDRDVRALFDRD
jgi:hypothetical protein